MDSKLLPTHFVIAAEALRIERLNALPPDGQSVPNKTS